MNICPITYERTNKRYSDRGLKILSGYLKELRDLELTKEEQLFEAVNRAPKMSIQGVQPKLSAVLNIKSGRFEVVDKGGEYILKPPNDFYKELLENEDLTMRLAKLTGFNIPVHGLIYAKDDTLTYFIKRFDRKGRNKKIHIEDFAQLSGASRDTKYNSSMEKVVKIIETFCTFPAVEKLKLFELTLFNYLTGNEDMHLKNFSVIMEKGKVELSPFYDLVNTSIALPAAKEEIALPIRDRRNNISKNDLLDYFGQKVCGLNGKVVNKSIDKFKSVAPEWEKLIDKSFLSAAKKEQYLELLRIRRLNIFK